MEHIGEGILDIPNNWHNSTINVFTMSPPDVPGLAITINREVLPLGLEFEEYSSEQLQQLQQKLKQFKLIHDVVVEVDGHLGRFCEFTWRPDQSKVAHQLLLCLQNKTRLINFAVSQMGPMDDSLREQMARMLLSFRFQPPEQEQETCG